jgi:hypothetical protein
MAGTVGAGSLRTDVHQDLVDRTPRTSNFGIVEDGQRIQYSRVIQPFERSRTTNVRSLSEFYELFQKILVAASEYEGKAYQIRFTKEYPPIDAQLPSFTVRLVERGPLVINGKEERTPRHVETFTDPDFPGDVIDQEIRRVANTIELVVWARTGDACDELATWVERKFFEYVWTIQWGGLSHPVIWLGRGGDIHREEAKQHIHGAPHRFQVVTSEITQRRKTAMRRIDTVVGILSETVAT